MKSIRSNTRLFLIFFVVFGHISCSSSEDLTYNRVSDEITNRNGDQNQAGVCTESESVLDDFNIYRGNTHSHTIYSWSHGSHRTSCQGKGCDLEEDWDDFNAQGLPSDHLLLAKDNNHDFYVVTDHSSDPPLAGSDDYGWGDIKNEYDWAANPWQNTLNATEQATDENFVALPGFEYGRNSDPDGTGTGHINPINTAGHVDAMGENGTSIPELYSWLKTVQPAGGTGHVVASFNHPSRQQFNDWAYLDDEIVDIITMFELRTVFRGRGPRWSGFVRALNKGWKVSPISVADNHGYWNIINTPNLTYVLAPELTKEAITLAMKERRTYTSWAGLRDTQVDLKYSVNGCIMGSTLDKPTVFNFRIEVNTHPTDTGQDVRRIQILRNHPTDPDAVQVAAEQEFNNGNEVVWTPKVEDSTAAYFLLRIHHANDMENGSFNIHGSTYSAPVWTGR